MRHKKIYHFGEKSGDFPCEKGNVIILLSPQTSPNARLMTIQEIIAAIQLGVEVPPFALHMVLTQKGWKGALTEVRKKANTPTKNDVTRVLKHGARSKWKAAVVDAAREIICERVPQKAYSSRQSV